MILKRLGNKSKIAMDIQKYFPKHKIYIEPFFGAGGMFFNKTKVKYNIVNDIDSDVFNLFQVVSNNKNELEEGFLRMPIHTDLLNYWKENKEVEPIKRALRFIFLSNFTLMGTGTSLRVGATGGSAGIKEGLYLELNKTFEYIKDVQFLNCDFRKIFSSISLDDRTGKGESGETFIYCDPPYLDTVDNYSQSFKEQDASDLFDCLIETKCKFAYSEFDHPYILEQAGKRGLNVIVIGERQNLKNRRTEILVTNYKKPLSLFDGV